MPLSLTPHLVLYERKANNGWYLSTLPTRVSAQKTEFDSFIPLCRVATFFIWVPEILRREQPCCKQ